VNIGKCHFGDFDEPASTLAVGEDGVGWIAVCDRHRERAEQEGYRLDSVAEPAERPVEGKPAPPGPARPSAEPPTGQAPDSGLRLIDRLLSEPGTTDRGGSAAPRAARRNG
jgi:hypothetical protein